LKNFSSFPYIFNENAESDQKGIHETFPKLAQSTFPIYVLFGAVMKRMKLKYIRKRSTLNPRGNHVYASFRHQQIA
jgi:hypothetical protein